MNEKEKQNDVSREGDFRDKGNGDGDRLSLTEGLSNIPPKNKLTKKKNRKENTKLPRLKIKKNQKEVKT